MLWRETSEGLWGQYSHLPSRVKGVLFGLGGGFFFLNCLHLPRFYTINRTTSHGSVKHNTNKVTVLLMSKQLQRALSCLSWTRGSHQSPDEPSSVSNRTSPCQSSATSICEGWGENLSSNQFWSHHFFSVLQVCFRMPLGAEWIWLSLNQTIAAFRRKSLRKLPLKLAVCCAQTPASLHGPHFAQSYVRGFTQSSALTAWGVRFETKAH